MEEQYLKTLEKELKDLKEQHAAQTGMFEMTTLYLKKLQQDLSYSEQKLQETNRNLTDSINYSKRIQDAFIVDQKVLQQVLPQSFVFSLPKDIVSGDFVWLQQAHAQIYLAVGDCTGHGVPGAMLTIFIVSILNQASIGLKELAPAEILDNLDVLMQKYLGQYTNQLRDSAEIGLIKYDVKQKKIIFSGANRPLVLVRNKKATVIKGSKFNLGYPDSRMEVLNNKEIKTESEDMLYMFSDGFPDQFGGSKNSKFLSKNFLFLLEEISLLTINKQPMKLAETISLWKGLNEQTDDISIIGIRI
jgi:serine phosphatase RsbU (regulator of sigma subunit)